MNELINLLADHEPELLELSDWADGKYILEPGESPAAFSFVRHKSLRAIDGRMEGMNLNYDAMPECTRFLGYRPGDQIEFLDMDITPGDEAVFRVDGLGSGGKGYIECRRLQENWFFVDAYLPT